MFLSRVCFAVLEMELLLFPGVHRGLQGRGLGQSTALDMNGGCQAAVIAYF